jgi:Holliday junction resolvase RusA-like endonuclease
LDVDNVLKVMLDALNGVAYADDKQVRRVSIEAVHDPECPRVAVVVERL